MGKAATLKKMRRVEKNGGGVPFWSAKKLRSLSKLSKTHGVDVVLAPSSFCDENDFSLAQRQELFQKMSEMPLTHSDIEQLLSIHPEGLTIKDVEDYFRQSEGESAEQQDEADFAEGAA